MIAWRRSTIRFGIAALLVTSGCGGDGAGGDEFAVRDSAGVEIVENGPGVPTVRWEVSPQPGLQLGAADAEGPEQFVDVQVTRLSTGEVVVLETRGAELRFFDGSGKHLRTVGGVGGGPGEFRSATAMTRAAGDTLLVQDLLMRSVLVFSPTGEFVRSYAARPFGPGLASSCFRAPVLPDGSLIRCGEGEGVAGGPSAFAEAPVEQVFRLARLLPETDSIQPIRFFTQNRGYTLVVGEFLTGVRHPFQPAGHLAAGADPRRLLIADGADYSVEVWTFDGRLERIVRSTAPARVPTADESEQAWAQVLASADEMFAGRIEAVVERPSTVPAIQGLLAGPRGEIWVKREPFLDSQTRTVFDVFDGSGRRVAEVTLPVVMNVLEVGDDYLLGVRKDELDVQTVEMYEFTRS